MLKIRRFPNRGHSRLLLSYLQRNGFRTKEWFFHKDSNGGFRVAVFIGAKRPKLRRSRRSLVVRAGQELADFPRL